MPIDPRAGKPATPDMLVDVPKLIAAYYDQKPDVAVPTQRVAFGTSGHRGSSFDTTFNENHILATSQAICEYRKAEGTSGPLFLAKDTHALSEPAFKSAMEVLAGQRGRGDGRYGAGLHADSGAVARGVDLQPRAEGKAVGRDCHHAIAQSAERWRLQVQPDQRRSGGHDGDEMDSGPS